MVSILVEENQWSSQDISAHKTPEIKMAGTGWQCKHCAINTCKDEAHGLRCWEKQEPDRNGTEPLSCGQWSLFSVMILPSEAFIVPYRVQSVSANKN